MIVSGVNALLVGRFAIPCALQSKAFNRGGREGFAEVAKVSLFAARVVGRYAEGANDAEDAVHEQQIEKKIGGEADGGESVEIFAPLRDPA